MPAGFFHPPHGLCPVVLNVADSASAGIHGRPPVWLVAFQARSTSCISDCTATCFRLSVAVEVASSSDWLVGWCFDVI